MAFDVDKAVAFLDEHAGKRSRFRCAEFVRRALQAGGIDLQADHPASARDYGPYLERAGFIAVPVMPGTYTPRKGDVIVLQNYEGGDVHGHIAMFDGGKWVSDFVQRDRWGGPGYRDAQASFTIYRP